MTRLPWIVAAVLLLATLGCGGTSNNGACEENYTGHYWCHNFHNTSTQTGEEICAGVLGTWTAGETCQSLGYTTGCTDGSFVKPSGSCL